MGIRSWRTLRRTIFESLHEQEEMDMTRIIAGLFSLITLGVFLIGCSDYEVSGLPDEMNLQYYRDCTTVVGDRYGYSDHTFGVVLLYDGCETDSHNAYLLIEHEFEEMDQEWTTAQYTTENGDTITVDAAYYSLDLWYNPVDIELEVIPYEGRTAYGIHEFWLDCPDDDSSSCPVSYVSSVGPGDLH